MTRASNRRVKEEKYQVAIKMLNRSHDFLSNCNDDTSKALKTAVFLNKALCFLKLGDSYEAKSACDVVLEVDSKCIKAYYRRGLAFVALGCIENALDDFKKVQELEPSNKAAQNQIVLMKQKLKEATEKERKIYANMFAKFANADKQREETERNLNADVLSSCGEWNAPEDTMRNVHPNIVMLDNVDDP